MKTCDCFFNVGLFAKMNQLKYEEFHKLCTRNRTKSFLFLLLESKNSQKTSWIDFVHWFGENDSVCCSQDIGIDDYCPPCQKIVLLEFSKNLHDFNADFCLLF